MLSFFVEDKYFRNFSRFDVRLAKTTVIKVMFTLVELMDKRIGKNLNVLKALFCSMDGLATRHIMFRWLPSTLQPSGFARILRRDLKKFGASQFCHSLPWGRFSLVMMMNLALHLKRLHLTPKHICNFSKRHFVLWPKLQGMVPVSNCWQYKHKL